MSDALLLLARAVMRLNTSYKWQGASFIKLNLRTKTILYYKIFQNCGQVGTVYVQSKFIVSLEVKMRK